jgi:hypothetical protein
MKNYKFLEIDNHLVVSEDVYQYIVSHTDIMTTKNFWTDLNVDDVLNHVPLLKKVLDEYKLTASQIAVIYVEPKSTADVHIDFNPNIRILWPIKNCDRSVTTFYHVDKTKVQARRLSNGIWYNRISNTVVPEFIENFSLVKPVVFNPSVAHGIASDTDSNEPRLSLTVGFTTSVDYLLAQ